MKALSYGVMIYMLLALIWWTILLRKTNNALYRSKIDTLQITQNQLYDVSAFDISKTEEFTTLTRQFNRNSYMILGEGLVFGISLILGIWFIQKASSKEVENSNKQKNFLLSITHELKSPIASINLITQTLLKRKVSQENLTDLHQSILSESTRLEKLINNLLLTTRLNNAYQYNFEQTDLVPLMDEIIRKLQFQYPKVVIEKSYSQDELYINGDKEAIFSVFNNLIENGIKYSRESGTIHVVLDTKQGQEITIDIIDEGIGIPDVEKKKIFQQFYRIGNEETRETKGTGLGLYIVDKIVKAHQGSIKVLDNQPKGSRFSIILPIGN
jgi:signal transduction histidine kinase